MCLGLLSGEDEVAMSIRDEMDKIYASLPPEDIPWNIATPPALLVEAIESGRVKACRAIDLGCGAGNYAVWLAGHGYEVTGLDISEAGIAIARQLAISEGMTCHFEAVDLFGDLSEYRQQFDFAFDWELMHHIFPEDRNRY